MRVEPDSKLPPIGADEARDAKLAQEGTTLGSAVDENKEKSKRSQSTIHLRCRIVSNPVQLQMQPRTGFFHEKIMQVFQ